MKSRYSTWTVCKGTAGLAKDENCKIWDSRSLLTGCRLVFKNEWKNWRWQDLYFCRVILRAFHVIPTLMTATSLLMLWMWWWWWCCGSCDRHCCKLIRGNMSGDFLWIYSISVRCSWPQACQQFYPHQGHRVSDIFKCSILKILNLPVPQITDSFVLWQHCQTLHGEPFFPCEMYT